MAKKLDMVKLFMDLREGYLMACLADTCDCVTYEAHEKNVALAKKLGLTAK